jgi:hypothetical protein
MEELTGLIGREEAQKVWRGWRQDSTNKRSKDPPTSGPSFFSCFIL